MKPGRRTGPRGREVIPYIPLPGDNEAKGVKSSMGSQRIPIWLSSVEQGVHPDTVPILRELTWSKATVVSSNIDSHMRQWRWFLPDLFVLLEAFQYSVVSICSGSSEELGSYRMETCQLQVSEGVSWKAKILRCLGIRKKREDWYFFHSKTLWLPYFFIVLHHNQLWLLSTWHCFLFFFFFTFIHVQMHCIWCSFQPSLNLFFPDSHLPAFMSLFMCALNLFVPLGFRKTIK